MSPRGCAVSAVRRSFLALGCFALVGLLYIMMIRVFRRTAKAALQRPESAEVEFTIDIADWRSVSNTYEWQARRRSAANVGAEESD